MSQAQPDRATAPDDPTDLPAASHRRRTRKRRQEAEPNTSITVTPDEPTKPEPTKPGPTQPGPKAPRSAAPEPVAEVLSNVDDGTGRPDRAPAEWANFAPQAPAPPSRVVVRTAGLRRVLSHEWTIAALLAVALSLVLNWRAFRDPTHTLPHDPWDPALAAYLIAWGGHALLHAPTLLWQVNGFYPSPLGLAYGDSLLGYAPAAIFGYGPQTALVRYNLLFIAAEALTVFGAYALVRQLGIGRVGAALAGVSFAFAPWRLGQAGHLPVLSTGGMVLALAMLARGHGVRWVDRGPDPLPTRPGWALAGWLVAAWQITLGFGIGLVFVYVLLGLVVGYALYRGIRVRSWPGKRMLAADGIGMLVFASVAMLMAQPYLKVLELYPSARRNADVVKLYSPPVRGLLTAPAESWLWGGTHAGARAPFAVPGEMALLPGFALCALAAAGLVFSVWSLRVRLALLGGVVGTVILALGTHGPFGGRAGYLLLLNYLPGFDGLRAPGRFIIWTTLLLGLLAAGAVCALVARASDVALTRGLPRPSPLAQAALLLPVLLVLVEGLGTTPHPPVPSPPPVLSSVAAPYLVLPIDPASDKQVMLWSTDRFADVVNGDSGVVPTELQRTTQVLKSFPDQVSVEYLRAMGVRTVVVLLDRVQGTPLAQAAQLPIDGLGLTRRVVPGAVVFAIT
jgi:hypothetical protein